MASQNRDRSTHWSLERPRISSAPLARCAASGARHDFTVRDIAIARRKARVNALLAPPHHEGPAQHRDSTCSENTLSSRLGLTRDRFAGIAEMRPNDEFYLRGRGPRT
jgi:ribosomal protein S14